MNYVRSRQPECFFALNKEGARTYIQIFSAAREPIQEIVEELSKRHLIEIKIGRISPEAVNIQCRRNWGIAYKNMPGPHIRRNGTIYMHEARVNSDNRAELEAFLEKQHVMKSKEEITDYYTEKLGENPGAFR
jgi:hypothetical protein